MRWTRPPSICACRCSPGRRFQATKAAVKLHTMMDLRGNIPLVVHIDDGKSYDTDMLDVIIPEPGAVYVMDRGYLDLARLDRLTVAGAFFILRTRRNLSYVVSHRGPSTHHGVVCDQIVGSPGETRPGSILTACAASATAIPKPARPSSSSPTTSLCRPRHRRLYRRRWQIELFFKWVKQHLRIKSFFGTTQNAVKTQIWIAVAVYVLIAIVKKRLALRPASTQSAIAQRHRLRENPAQSTAPRGPARKPTAPARQTNLISSTISRTLRSDGPGPVKQAGRKNETLSPTAAAVPWSPRFTTICQLAACSLSAPFQLAEKWRFLAADLHHRRRPA